MFIPTPGKDELLDIPILNFDEFYSTLTFGTTKIMYEPQSLSLSPIAYLRRTFEPKADGFIEGLRCGHCRDDPGFAQRYPIVRPQWVS